MKQINYGSKYWDLFEKRIKETTEALQHNNTPPIRRLSLHITNKCNLACSYCNECHNKKELSVELYSKLINEYSALGGGVLHITGGEPTCISYLSSLFVDIPLNVELHLNTNNVVRLKQEQYEKIKRLKISLDSQDRNYFNSLVGRNVFDTVIDNLKFIHTLKKKPLVSITYTVTKENYLDIPKFLQFYYSNFPKFYAVFFSCYKGSNERFTFKRIDIQKLFLDIVPKINNLTTQHKDNETKFLFNTSHRAKTFINGCRFSANKIIPCYLQLSELAINELGEVWNCSHLLRDGVCKTKYNIGENSLQEIWKQKRLQTLHPKCLYGCNRKLILFNIKVHNNLKEGKENA